MSEVEVRKRVRVFLIELIMGLNAINLGLAGLPISCIYTMGVRLSLSYSINDAISG